MNDETKTRFLIGASIVLLIGIGFYAARDYFPGSDPAPVSIPVEGQPEIGNPEAKVQAIVFEEPKCSGCKYFTLNIFPEIQREFIDTGLIRYTIVPVSFISGSMPIAVGWLCTYEEAKIRSNPDLFIAHVHETYTRLNTEGKEPKSGSSSNFEGCLNKEAFRKKIKYNTAFAMKLMNREISTPALYVDGVYVRNLSVSGVRKAIRKAIERKESNSERETVHSR